MAEFGPDDLELVKGSAGLRRELFVLRDLSCDVAGLRRIAGATGRDRAAEPQFTGT